jgi:2-polyprenyl-3-methyl-5-hydroxy-6-metoxy-1,4-benzoquinol methylase
MNETQKQGAYWSKELKQFDAIYTQRKSTPGRWLDRTFRIDMEWRYEYTLKHSEPIEGRRFLDVGCGTGKYALEFARRKAAWVTGIDVSSAMVDVCRRGAAQEGFSATTEFLNTDLLAYRPSIGYDVCIGIGLFDYIKDAAPVLAKMRECVKDRVVLSFPRQWTWRAPVRALRLAIKGCPVYFYSARKVGALLKQAGFSRWQTEVVGKLYCVTAYR